MRHHNTSVFLTALSTMALCAIISPTSAMAKKSSPAKSSIEGVIVQVNNEEMIVDLGTAQGLPAQDATLDVYRRVEVRHPRTKKMLTDRFPIGKVTLARVGTTLSVATKWDLNHGPKAGDFVVYQQPTPEPKEVREPPTSTKTQQRPEHEKALDAAYIASLGQPLTARIQIWDAYLRAHPESPYNTNIQKELVFLRAKLAEVRKATDARHLHKSKPRTRAPKPRKPTKPPVLGQISSPRVIEDTHPAKFNVTFRKPQYVHRVRTLIRKESKLSYNEIPFAKNGDYTWSMDVPISWIEPGRLEYFVEVIRTDGTSELVSGSADDPNILHVVPTVAPKDNKSNRSRATALFDVVNFRMGTGNDYYTRFEAEYRYNLRLPVLHAFTMGAGAFQGEGASVAEIEDGKPSRSRSLGYGFAQLEFRAEENLGISARLLMGQESKGETTFQGAFGLGGEVRVGPENGSRLELGGAFTQSIGNEAWINLHVDAIERLPMSASVVVTNLPVGADLGVSLNYGLGYEIVDGFKLLGRVGWNARTINYNGPSAGVSTEISW